MLENKRRVMEYMKLKQALSELKSKEKRLEFLRKRRIKFKSIKKKSVGAIKLSEFLKVLESKANRNDFETLIDEVWRVMGSFMEREIKDLDQDINKLTNEDIEIAYH